MAERDSGARQTSAEARDEFSQRAEKFWDKFNAWYQDHPEATLDEIAAAEHETTRYSEGRLSLVSVALNQLLLLLYLRLQAIGRVHGQLRVDLGSHQFAGRLENLYSLLSCYPLPGGSFSNGGLCIGDYPHLENRVRISIQMLVSPPILGNINYLGA